MSVTKSVTAAALGISIDRKLLSINDIVTNIAPEFTGTSLDGCTIRHLIDMTAGTEFVEKYDLYISILMPTILFLSTNDNQVIVPY